MLKRFDYSEQVVLTFLMFGITLEVENALAIYGKVGKRIKIRNITVEDEKFFKGYVRIFLFFKLPVFISRQEGFLTVLKSDDFECSEICNKITTVEVSVKN